MIGPVVLGGILVRARVIISARLARITNPITLTVQPKPILGRSCWAMIGKTTPPVAAPDAAQEIASDLFVEK